MSTFFVIVIVIAIVFFVVQSRIRLRKQQEAENETFAGQHSGWDIYKSPYGRGVLALNHDIKHVVVGTVTSYIERPWSNINTVEVQKNGQSIQQTNRGSQAIGAAVGALLLGPFGLLMGGLSGSKRQKARVNELSLKLIIDDRAAPVHTIVFFRMSGDGVDANSPLLKPPAQRMEHFHALLLNAIRSDQRETPTLQTQIAADDVETRIGKLWALLQTGAITNDEYALQKRVILSQGPADSLAAPQ